MSTKQANFGEFDSPAESEPTAEPTEKTGVPLGAYLESDEIESDERPAGPTSDRTPVGGFPRRVESLEWLTPGIEVSIDSPKGETYQVVKKTGNVVRIENGDSQFKFVGTGPEFSKRGGRFSHELHLVGFGETYDYPRDSWEEESEPLLAAEPEESHYPADPAENVEVWGGFDG